MTSEFISTVEAARRGPNFRNPVPASAGHDCSNRLAGRFCPPLEQPSESSSDQKIVSKRIPVTGISILPIRSFVASRITVLQLSTVVIGIRDTYGLHRNNAQKPQSFPNWNNANRSHNRELSCDGYARHRSGFPSRIRFSPLISAQILKLVSVPPGGCHAAEFSLRAKSDKNDASRIVSVTESAPLDLIDFPECSGISHWVISPQE